MLFTPLFQDSQLLGYMLALDAKEDDAFLLSWAAEALMASLEGEETLQGMTDELIGAWNQLELIYRFTEDLTFTTDLTANLHSILQEIRKVVQTDDGFIMLRRSATWDCVTYTGHLAESLRSQSFLNSLVDTKQVVLCESQLACRRVWPEVPPTVENMVATELPIQAGVTGALGLINKVDKKFTAGDTKLLAALAQQVGLIVKNFLAHQNLIIKERVSRELEIAAEIQKSLLPTKLPQVGGLSIAVASVPASEVGGDFYDFITVDERRLTLVMGDVAGKGIPAAMLTSVTRTMLRVEAMRGEPPHGIISQANNVLHQDLSRADSFVTAFVATIDTYEGTLNYASAGHIPALLWRADSRIVEQLRATSPPIGIFGYEGKAAHQVILNPGDTLVLYTDGITESQAPNGEFFGLNRLIYLVKSRALDPPEMLQQYIQSEIASFCGPSASRDDASLLVVKMLPQSETLSPQDISTIIKKVDFAYPAEVQYLGDIIEDAVSTCWELPALSAAGSRANDFIYLVELAISEICTNIIKHAYNRSKGEIVGSITLLNNGVQLDFYDQGLSFDPNEVAQPTSDPKSLVEGGYGLYIVRQIMDVVSYEHHPTHGNHWHLLKLLPS